ncbi:hypothetical protein MAA8898_04912 [Maliponia aquimaris]|uniref:Uncharacterized protein n=2 Tax=Maliponia aquimaris TaxID=1673631 RepID=A0A238L6Q0_9RHOB|nr:hypothetical protein MAA8898_04912 [Maliponia aquimaris]
MESFPPSGAALAEDIGLLSRICGVSEGPAARMHLHWREAAEIRKFEGDGPLLLRRREMHGALRSEALAHARHMPARVRQVSATGTGAEVVTDAGAVSCAMVVDARGRHAVKRKGSDLVGLAFAASDDVPDHSMWLEALPDAWLWACGTGMGRLHGVLFQRAETMAGLTAQARQAGVCRLLGQSASLAHVTDIKVARPVAAGLACVEDPVPAPRHVLIGDAALARDPIASHGLVHAIRSGVQAAVAVRTVLDPDGDTHAALSFLRTKHVQAVASARLATARAYRDQTRFTGPFWAQYGEETAPEAAPQAGPGPITLARPLTRAPVLDGDRIRWAAAIYLPASGDFFTRLGPVTALDIASACRPAAPLNTVAARLGRMHAAPLVFDVLTLLDRGGAIAQVPGPA